jgi:hypothetical protein
VQRRGLREPIQELLILARIGLLQAPRSRASLIGGAFSLLACLLAAAAAAQQPAPAGVELPAPPAVAVPQVPQVTAPPAVAVPQVPQVTPPVAPPAMPVLPAPAATAPLETGFPVVEVDLGQRAFVKPLPFDEPFILAGRVPAETRYVGIQYAESAPGVPLELFHPSWWPEPPLLWTHLPGLDQPDDRGRLLFRVLVQRLNPRRFYQFRFWMTPTLRQTDEFLLQASATLNRVLQGTTSTALRNEQLDALQAELLGGLRRMAASEELLTLGPILAQDGGASSSFKTAAEAVLVPQARLRESWGSYLVAQGELRAFQAEIRDSTVLDKLRALREQSLELLRQYEELLETYAARQAEAQAAQEPFDPNLSELISNLAEQVHRFRLITQQLDRYPALLSNARSALALAQELEAALLQDFSDMIAVEAVGEALVGTDPARLDALLAAYAAAEEAVAALRSYLTSVDTLEVLQKLVEARELSPGLGVSERDRLVELAGDTGLIRRTGADLLRIREALLSAQSNAYRRASALDVLRSDLRQVLRDKVLVLASTTEIIQTERRNYVSLDLGALYAFGLGGVEPYVGLNLYFRPINKNVPLRLQGAFAHRLSLTAGVTLTSVADDEDGVRTRGDLFLGRALFVGTGLRVTSSIRLGAGGVFFRKKDPNPLVDDSSLAFTPYASASLDVDIRGTFEKLGDAIGGLFK